MPDGQSVRKTSENNPEITETVDVQPMQLESNGYSIDLCNDPNLPPVALTIGNQHLKPSLGFLGRFCCRYYWLVSDLYSLIRPSF